MSKLKQVLREMKEPKGKPKQKSILINLTDFPEIWRWLERQSSIEGCSKTAYVKALIELDRINNKGID